jgi:plastocyanin
VLLFRREMNCLHDPGINVHAGDTIEWTSDDPMTAQTVTFGPEPQDLGRSVLQCNRRPRRSTSRRARFPSDAVHSALIQAAIQDRTGLAQTPSGVTRFRVTFSKPGIYPYIFSLHDVLGMKGRVVVLP